MTMIDSDPTLDTPTDEAPDAPEVPSSEVTQPEGDDAAELKILDPAEYEDYLVPVKVGGEVTNVPFSQVRDGLMMQADYTRKTQEVSARAAQLAEAQAIAEALERDPEGTIKILAEHYGSTPTDDELENLDPLERQVRELQGYVDAQEQAKQEAALQAELDHYHKQYGVDQAELLQFAVENGIPDLGWAVAVMQQGRAQAESELQRQREAQEAARLAAKQQAAVVDGGADRASGGSSLPTGGADTIKTVGDAFALAKRQLKV